MVFVTEPLTDDQIKKFDFKFNFNNGQIHKVWSIDRDRNTFLVKVYHTGGPYVGLPYEDGYVLSVDGKVVRIKLHQETKFINGETKYIWNILEINADIDMEKKILFGLISEAFESYVSELTKNSQRIYSSEVKFSEEK